MTAAAPGASPGVAGSSPRRRRVVVALARAEGRRLLRHPLLLVAVELSVYLFVRDVVSGPMPVGARVDVQIGFAMLPLAVGTLIAVNMAALRARLHDMEELFGSLPARLAHRVAAHVLSVSAPVALALVTVAVDLAILWIVARGAGSPNPFELMAGPAVVALAGVVGVLLARVAPWIGAAPVLAVGCAALWYLPYLLFKTAHQVWVRPSSWLFPWYGAQGSPADWIDPIAGAWHLAYVAGLVVLAACLAIGLSSVYRWVRAQTAVAAVLALVLGAGPLARAAAPDLALPWELRRLRVATGAAGTQVCTRDPGGRVQYCVWPGYQPWINRWWRAPVDGVLRRVPPAVRTGMLRVRQIELDDVATCRDASVCAQPSVGQQIDDEIARAYAESDVQPGASWPRDSAGRGRAQLELAASAGAWAVDLRTAPLAGGEKLTVCFPREARVVVALWLAGQATPGARESLVARTLGSPPVLRGARPRASMTLGRSVITPEWPWPEAVRAVQLLERRDDEVARRLTKEWARWTRRGTPTRELAEAFGLQPLPEAGAADLSGRQAGPTPDCDHREGDDAQGNN